MSTQTLRGTHVLAIAALGAMALTGCGTGEEGAAPSQSVTAAAPSGTSDPGGSPSGDAVCAVGSVDPWHERLAPGLAGADWPTLPAPAKALTELDGIALVEPAGDLRESGAKGAYELPVTVLDGVEGAEDGQHLTVVLLGDGLSLAEVEELRPEGPYLVFWEDTEQGAVPHAEGFWYELDVEPCSNSEGAVSQVSDPVAGIGSPLGWQETHTLAGMVEQLRAAQG